MDMHEWTTGTAVEKPAWSRSREIHFNVTNEITDNQHKCTWSAMNSCLAFLLFVTLILNVLSSVVLFRVPLVTVRGRSNPVYLCIRFLNVCDILQASFLILMPAFATPDCEWLGGRLSCNVLGFVVLFFLLVSPLITILMAFDRVIALYQPFKYRSHLGLKMLKMLLPAASVLVFITAILPIFGVGEYHVVKGRRLCLLDTITEDRIHRAYVIGVHTVFLLSLFFMVSCSVAFQVKLCRMSFIGKEPKSRKKPSSRRTKNATITTMAVCCIFIFCYLPYVIRVLVEASTLKKSPRWITWITFGLAFLQPLLNPVVYVGTNVRYRQELMMILKNMNVTDTETSSESGVTHIGSRRGFTGFRRKLSSGGSRNSKYGSNKRKAVGSHNSINALGRISDENVFYGLPHHNSKEMFSMHPHCGPDEYKSETKMMVDLKSTRHHVIANISSCVESRSCLDMKIKKRSLSFSTSIANGSCNTAPELSKYGRGNGGELNKYGRGIDAEPMVRQRSNTISEDNSRLLHENAIPDLASPAVHYTSVPKLLEARILAL